MCSDWFGVITASDKRKDSVAKRGGGGIMPVENPYVRVWHLIEAARGSVDPDRRRTLISEAFDVVKEARPPQAAEKESRKPVYGLKLESEGNPPLSLSLEVWSRADAFWAAEVIAIASSEEYDEFGLWE